MCGWCAVLVITRISRAEKNSMGNQSRPESRQESSSARKESRIDPISYSFLQSFRDSGLDFHRDS